MQQLSNSAQHHSSSGLNSQTEIVEESSGWDDQCDDGLDAYFKNKRITQKLIKLANDRLSLAKVFHKYQINFFQQYSPSGWTHKALCPFPDHNERTPSFAYNPTENRFYCFGCQRGGQTVQFISRMENIPPSEVARRLVKDSVSDEELSAEVEQTDNSEAIFEMLRDFAKQVSEFTKQHQADLKAIKYTETVSWPIDCYIRNHLPKGNIDKEQLSGRIALCKQYLDDYQIQKEKEQ